MLRTRVVPSSCPLDRGAYELQPVSCTGDVTGGGDNPPNGVVNIDDLLAVVAEWGHHGGYADTTCDGIVNIDDYLAVTGNWGNCPPQVFEDGPSQSGGEDDTPSGPPQWVLDCLDSCGDDGACLLACIQSHTE